MKVNIERLYPSSVNESRQRLIKFMLSVGATESTAIYEQSSVFTHLLGRFSAAGMTLWSL